MLIIVPHVAVVGRALVPMVLVVVGFQLLIHVKGSLAKAYWPSGDSKNNISRDSSSRCC